MRDGLGACRGSGRTAGGLGVNGPRVITLWQPWASLVALGLKANETRSWATSYRGPVYVHAARTWNVFNRRAWEEAEVFVFDARANGLNVPPLPRRPPLGVVVCRCTLTRCRPTPPSLVAAAPEHYLDERFGDWRPGRFAHSLSAVEPLPEPVPWPGRQGRYWQAPAELVALIEAQLGPAPVVTGPPSLFPV